MYSYDMLYYSVGLYPICVNKVIKNYTLSTLIDFMLPGEKQ